MQETQIILHIRSMYFRSKFIGISDHVSNPKLYYIENQIFIHYESYTTLILFVIQTSIEMFVPMINTETYVRHLNIDKNVFL